MGKIGDLWVRLGLKSDDYKKGIKEAGKEADGFGAKLGKLKAGALAVWAAIGAGVIKLANDTISASNMMADAWEQQIGRIKASYRSLLAQLSTNNKREKGWWLRLFNPNDSAGYDVGANAREAGEAARKMVEAFDAEFELVNSVRLQRAAVQQELNELYVQMRDTTQSPQARKAAQERYKALLEPIAKAEIDVYTNMLDSAVDAWQAGNSDILSKKYSTAEVSDFFKMYGTNPNAAREQYGELAQVYETRQNDEFNTLMVDTMLKLDNARNQMSEIEKTMGKVTISINAKLAEQEALLANAMQESFDSVMEDIDNLEDAFEDIELVIPPIDTSALDAGLAAIEANAAKYEEVLAKSAQANAMLEGAIVASTANTFQAFSDLLFGIEGANAETVLAALMQPFADTAGQLGSMLITEGLAIEAFKTSLSSLQGGVAIAAGAALLAVSAAMKSGIKALAGNQAGAGSSVSYGGAMGNPLENYESTLTVYVEGKISGSDILLAGKKTQSKWNR